MAESETKSERLSIAVTPSEKAALEYHAAVHPEKYESWHQVVRDLSIADAVAAFARAEAAIKAANHR